MIEQYSRQTGFLLEEGCTPAQVGPGRREVRLRDGPLSAWCDLAGNDIGWYIRKRRYQEKPELRYSKTADLLCEMGRYGQKTGAGWYDYKPGKRDAIPSALVEQMIADHRKELGITPRKISDEEIVHRLVFALVNEGVPHCRGRHRQQGQRHRHGLPHRLRLSRCTARRPDVLRRYRGPVQRGAGHEAVRPQPARRRQLLAAWRPCWQRLAAEGKSFS